MTQDEALAVLFKLVGDKPRCLELIQSVREAFPGKSMQWCIEKAIYDVRFPKKAVKPNATLSRWGEGGGNFPATVQPPSKTSNHPPAPPPNPLLSQLPQPQAKPQEIRASLPDLAALAKAKRSQRNQQPASATVKYRLDSLTKDRKVSDRLVQRIQFSNPDRSEQWCYEKAVYDLERDRA